MKKLLLTITMLAMALTVQASPTTLLLTSDTDAATAVAGGIGILWLAFFITGIVWLIFPFVVWAKLNRLIDNTHRALNNLRIIAKAGEELDQPPSQP